MSLLEKQRLFALALKKTTKLCFSRSFIVTFATSKEE